ncbi:MAG TPA: hypothetical protein PK530_20875 [Anaerolineales bacterium]|nr:hypothetical protein [Anaerolineales bacterium]
MAKYTYPKGFDKEVASDLTLVMIVFGVAGLLLLAVLSTFPSGTDYFPSNKVAWFIEGILVVFVTIYLGNLYPNITTDVQGIHFKFLWFMVHVPWMKIVAMKEIRKSSFTPARWFVQANKLTWFHRVYGFFHFGKLESGFLIHPKIENHRELLDEIMDKSRNHT